VIWIEELEEEAVAEGRERRAVGDEGETGKCYRLPGKTETIPASHDRCVRTFFEGRINADKGRSEGGRRGAFSLRKIISAREKSTFETKLQETPVTQGKNQAALLE